VNGVEGAVTDAVIASFSDGDPGGAVGDFLCSIDWGDGIMSAGLVVQPEGPGTLFQVRGSHVYAEEGKYRAVATFVNTDGGSVSVGRSTLTAPATAVTVSDAPLTVLGMSTATATTGRSSLFKVASFRDANPNAKPGEFAATIDWGDGTTSPGSVSMAPVVGASFEVEGVHVYASSGAFQVTVRISDAGGAATTALTSVSSFSRAKSRPSRSVRPQTPAGLSPLSRGAPAPDRASGPVRRPGLAVAVGEARRAAAEHRAREVEERLGRWEADLRAARAAARADAARAAESRHAELAVLRREVEGARNAASVPRRPDEIHHLDIALGEWE
jgi:hypothetical protein